jgi:hypothetical protein
MAGGKEGEQPRERTSYKTTQPEQSPKPYPRVTGRGGKRSIDLAPYTPEEEAEIRRGGSEWEIQSRRIRARSLSANGEGGQSTPLAARGQEQLSPKEKKRESHRRSYRKHRAKRLEYQRRYDQDHRAEIAEKRQDSYRNKYQKHKPFRQILAEVQEEQRRYPQSLEGQIEAKLIQKEGKQQKKAKHIFP